MIPYELISMITAHLTASNESSPVIFEVPLSYQLHRIIIIPPLSVQLPVSSAPSTHVLQHTRASRPVSPGFAHVLWTHKLMRKAFVPSASISSPSPMRANPNPHGVILGKKTTRPHSVSITPPSAHRHLSTDDHSSRDSTDNEKVFRHLAPYVSLPLYCF